MVSISEILSFVRSLRNDANISDVKIDMGGNYNVTCENFTPSGDDSFPLNTDYAAAIPTKRTGVNVIVGYVDPINTPKALEGDKRIYARQSSDGAVVAELWLKNDGSTILSNANGSIELAANGDVTINGVTIAANGDVTIPSSLSLSGKEIAGHSHSQGVDSDGNTQVDTGPNN